MSETSEETGDLPAPAVRPHQLLVLAAGDEAGVERAAAGLAEFLAAQPEVELADVACALQMRVVDGEARELRHRRMLVCRSREEAISALRGGGAARVWKGSPGDGAAPAVAFLFAGVGDHYPGMARGLYATEPVFRAAIDRSAEALRPLLGLDLRGVLFPPQGEGAAPVAASGAVRPSLREMLGRAAAPKSIQEPRPLDRTLFLHPAMFALEHALARLWMSWGIAPAALLGYSVGEYAAACMAGVVSVDDALRLVAARARLVDALPPGAMTSVFLPATELAPLLGPELALAAENGPTLSVAAGPEAAVAALEAALRARRVSFRRLAAGHAFHSDGLAAAVPAVVAAAAALDLRPPSIPLVSNVTGGFLSAAEATDPEYWGRHMCRTVRFAAGLGALAARGLDTLVEIGPGNTLASMALQPGMPGPPRLAVPSLPHAHDPEPDTAALATALGRLWLAGVEPDWREFHRAEPRRRVTLPPRLPA